MPKADVKAARGAARQNLVYSEGHRKIVVVSSSMLRLWMVDWSTRKFTYTIDQDSMHKRYEHHISTTTIILELLIIVNQVVNNCLKQSPVIFNYFCSKQSAAYFCLTETPLLYLIYSIAEELLLLHYITLPQNHQHK